MSKIVCNRFIAAVAAVIALLSCQARGEESSQIAMSTASSARASKADRVLQRSVRKALAKTKGLTVTNITIRARNGVVLLEGSVVDQSQADLAAEVGIAVPGVKSIKNTLTLRPIQ